MENTYDKPETDAKNTNERKKKRNNNLLIPESVNMHT